MRTNCLTTTANSIELVSVDKQGESHNNRRTLSRRFKVCLLFTHFKVADLVQVGLLRWRAVDPQLPEKSGPRPHGHRSRQRSLFLANSGSNPAIE